MGDATHQVTTRQTVRGRGMATSRASPSQNTTRAQVVIPPHVVIPIVFIPGIMGSNLKALWDIKYPSSGRVAAKAGAQVWNVDSSVSAAGWTIKTPAFRQIVLNKDAVEVDHGGRIERTTSRGNYVGHTPIARLPVELARKRGWGTVSCQFYGGFLDWLQRQLQIESAPRHQSSVLTELQRLVGQTPPGATKTVPPLTNEAIQKAGSFQFPVHAAGYNWLQSNLTSGRELANKIQREILPLYNQISGQRCTQVILVTHSMGGLVARAASQAASDSILGVIHGVMPGDGAAAFYKRLAAGFSSEGGGLMGAIQGYALGSTARDTTPVIAYNPGPLELAPNKLYNSGKPWLFIKDAGGKTLKALPDHGDPYIDIYAKTDVAWRALTPDWLNPARVSSVESATVQYLRTLAAAAEYHHQIGGKVHPQTYAHYSDDKQQKSWGTLSWRVEAGEMYTPPALAVGLAPATPQWIPNHRRNPGPPETWRFVGLPSGSTRSLRDAGGELQMSIVPSADSGDATVPAAASAAQVSGHEGSQLTCSHRPGYEHSASYSAAQVRHTVLDAIVRLIGPVSTT